MFPSFRNTETWNMLNTTISDELKLLDLSKNKPYDAIHKFSEWLSKTLYDNLKDFKNTETEIKEIRKKNREYFLKRKAPFIGKQINNQKPTCSMDAMYRYFKYLSAKKADNSTYDHIKFDIKITHKYNNSPITEKEFIELFDKSSSGNKDSYGLSYGIFKKLPCTHKYICDLLNNLPANIDNPTWSQSVIYPGHKKGPSDIPKNFRSLQKFSILTRVYNRIMSRRIYNFLAANNILDMEVQKGYKDVYGGVFNNINVCKNIINEANEKKRNLSVIFLDVQNAYGSISFKFIKHILKIYKIPTHIADYIYNYHITSTGYIQIGQTKSDIINLDHGLHAGCAMGNILFLMCFNLFIYELSNKYSYGYIIKYKDLIYKLFLLAFMDDLTIITESLKEGKEVFTDLVMILEKYNLFIAYDKCRYVEIGHNTGELKINDNIVKQITLDDKFKYLGSPILLDVMQEIKKYREDLLEKFQKVNELKSPVSNSDKIFLYNNYISRKILWDFQFFFWEPVNIIDIELRYLEKWGVKEPDTYLIARNERIKARKITNHYKMSCKSLKPYSEMLLGQLTDHEITACLGLTEKPDTTQITYNSVIL